MARGRFVRDNIFLVAAVSLPLVVVAFFLLSAVLPRWLVPPPTYDLLLRTRTYDQTAARIAVDITVNGDRVEARAPVAFSRDAYLQRPMLWLFEHKTLTVRQIPLDLPTWLDEREPPQTIAIDALKGRRMLLSADRRAKRALIVAPLSGEPRSGTSHRDGVVRSVAMEMVGLKTEEVYRRYARR